MGIRTTNIGDVTFVEFPENCDLDQARIEAFREPLTRLVEGAATTPLVLDLANVAFISSQALGFLVTLRLKAARVGKPVALVGVREALVEIIGLTQIDKLYGVFPSREAAAASLGNKQ